jgi:hypothetical protein
MPTVEISFDGKPLYITEHARLTHRNQPLAAGYPRSIDMQQFSNRVIRPLTKHSLRRTTHELLEIGFYVLKIKVILIK